MRYNTAMSAYLGVLLYCVLVPLAFSFWPSLKFWRHYRELAATLAQVAVVFTAWDVYATWRGHWSFDPRMVLPLRLFNLPLEEVLFFLVIPFCCIFSWEVIVYLRRRLR
jgi:lycopene cyclase domain-containing protein